MNTTWDIAGFPWTKKNLSKEEWMNFFAETPISPKLNSMKSPGEKLSLLAAFVSTKSLILFKYLLCPILSEPNPTQELINTYGVPRYREANPAYFATIFFPFLFGVMFGDIGHGSMLLAFCKKDIKELERNSNFRLLECPRIKEVKINFGSSS